MGLKQKFLEFFGEDVDDEETEEKIVQEETAEKQQPNQQAKTYRP